MGESLLGKAFRQLRTLQRCVWTSQVTSQCYQAEKSHRMYSSDIRKHDVYTEKFGRAQSVFGSQSSLNLNLLPSNSWRLIRVHHHHSDYNHNHDYTNALLENISMRISNNDLAVDDLSLWINKVHSSLFDHFSFHLPCKYPLNKKKQMFYSVFRKDFEMRFTSNPMFQEIISFVEENMDRIRIAHCPVLFSFLSLLLEKGHPLLQSLDKICKDNLHQLQLHEIVIFLESKTFCMPNDFETGSEISKDIKERMSDGFISDPNLLRIFCEICSHTGYLMNKDTFMKTLLFVINSICDNDLLAHDPVETVNILCRFPLGLFGDLDEDVREKILELERKFDRIEFNVTDLDVDTCLNLGTVLDSVLNHSFLKTLRWESFLNVLVKKEVDSDPLELLKLCFLFFTTDITQNFVPNGYQEQNTCVHHRLSRLIDVCDNFWLIQMLQLKKLPLEIKKKIQRKVQKLAEDLSDKHINWIFDEIEDEITLLLLFKNLSRKPSMGTFSTTMMNRVTPKTCSIVENMSTEAKAVVMLWKITDDLLNNHILDQRNLEFGLKLVDRMNFQRMLYLLRLFNYALIKGSHYRIDKNWKQIQQFTNTLEKAIQDKFSSASFLPPFNLLEKQSVFYVPSSKSLSSSTVTQLIKSLSTSTSTLDRRVCLRAITVLHKVSCHKPCYVPETFENLLQFVYSNEDVPLHSFLELLKTISLAGYLPEDADRFKMLCLQIQLDAIRTNLLAPLEQLELMYHMSLMESYENIHHYLSVDTLLDLDKEINYLRMFNSTSATYFYDCLFHLIQNTVVECPHLSLHPFVKSCDLSKESTNPLFSPLLESVKRVFNDSSCIASSTHSPYGHSIDILINLDWDGYAFELKHADDSLHQYYSNTDISSYRLALVYLNENHFCEMDDRRLTGVKLASLRQLQLLGYTVIDVSVPMAISCLHLLTILS